MPHLTQKPLTQRIIDTTPIPATGSVTLRDPVERGLTLRIWPSGKKSWSLEYRSPISGKNARLGLPAGTLAEARQLAQAHRTTVAFGRDPALEAKQDLAERRESHAKAITVAAAVTLYTENKLASGNKLESWRYRLGVLRRALAGLEDRPVASLSRADIILRLDRIELDAGGVTRNRSQAEMRAWLGWLQHRDLITTNPLDRIRMSVKEVPRERVLSDDELRDLMRATTNRSTFADVVTVLLHTATRRNEVATLQPGDINFDQKTITVRAEVSKTNRARTIPMSEAIEGVLQERARGLGRDQYLFGDGSNFEKPFTGFSAPLAKLREAMAVEIEAKDGAWTLHDIRRTVATRMHEAGIDALVIEDLLGHQGGIRRGVAGVYNRARTLERQRQALETWSTTLQTLAAE